MARQPPGAAPSFATGLLDIAPVVVAVVPIGMLFGGLAVGKGMSIAEAGLMSLAVFGGGAQFAALSLWTYPLPIGALAFSTLLVNLRLMLMGASLDRKTRGFSAPGKLTAFYFLTDESWSLAERRALAGPVGPAYWAGVSTPLPFAWVGATLLGAWLGSLLGDPARFGADFAFAAVFIGLIASFWKGRSTAYVVAASAVASALAYLAAGPPWHVAAGAFAGIVAAYVAAKPDAAAA